MLMPSKWEARIRCVEFWVKVLKMEDKRVIRVVALEAWEDHGKVKWPEDFRCSLEKFRWSSEVMDEIEGVSVNEVRRILMEGGCDGRCMQGFKEGT